MRWLDYSDVNSVVNRFRRRRTLLVRYLLDLVRTSGRPLRILDIGGTVQFWHMTGLGMENRDAIVLLNREFGEKPDLSSEPFQFVRGSALDLPFPNCSFDVVFSNSVIEHVGSKAAQMTMASEARRVGKRFVVQTPSRWFPLEPHCHWPLIHYLPRRGRAVFLRFFHLNYFPKSSTYAQALAAADTTILMTATDLETCFPGAEILCERCLGLPKSYMAIGGWDPVTVRQEWTSIARGWIFPAACRCTR